MGNKILVAFGGDLHMRYFWSCMLEVQSTLCQGGSEWFHLPARPREEWNPKQIGIMDPKLYVAAADCNINVLQEYKDIHLQFTPENNTVLHVAAKFGQSRRSLSGMVRHCCSCQIRKGTLRFTLGPKQAYESGENSDQWGQEGHKKRGFGRVQDNGEDYEWREKHSLTWGSEKSSQ